MKLLLFSAICLLTFSSRATETEKIIKSKPEKATVYLQGAQVFRSGTINIPQGQSVLVFEGLENSIDPQSIQASGSGNCIITETQYLLHYPELQKFKVSSGGAKYAKARKQISDSLTLMSYEMEEMQNQKDVLTTEKEVLLNYGLYKGLSKKDSLAFLKEGLVFLREKLNNINSELLKLKKLEARTQLKIDLLTQRQIQIENEENNINSSSQAENKPDYRITVTVMADAPTTANIGINYFVPNAGWAPMYDLRTESVDKPIQLSYKATVFQNTGADWKEVKLTLSTADPKQNFTIPELNPYFVDVYKNLTKESYKLNPATVTGSTLNMTTTLGASTPNFSVNNPATQQKDVVIGSNEAYEYVVMDDNIIQAEFEIKLPYSIPSDNKNHYVSILNKELKTKYVHKTIPKMDLKAYLTARITNYEELNLLPGKANVYFGGTFIGKTFIKTGDTGDTLELSLGQDKNVNVKRTKIKDKSKEKVLDNDKFYDMAYEIIIKNGNSKNIEIEVIDQIPLTKNQQITLEKIELHGAQQDETTGEIMWRNHIKSKENKKNAFSFTVKAPKNMQLVVK
ncbi:MAG: hypothetical protein K0S33_2910 [Bacteroidetes bacterium]|nr:hypothetical protein [Bacteroidota bacterium]